MIFFFFFFFLSFWPEGVNVGVKWGFSKPVQVKYHCMKIFMIICLKLHQYKALKKTQMIFLWNTLYWGFQRTRSPIFFFFFFHFWNKSVHWIFLIFCIALQQLTKFFDRILVLGFWEHKYLKIGHDLKFWKFYGESNILHEFRPAWKLKIGLHIFWGGQ